MYIMMRELKCNVAFNVETLIANNQQDISLIEMNSLMQ